LHTERKTAVHSCPNRTYTTRHYSRERKTNRYFISKTTSTGRAAHIGAFHKYCYWRAEIRVSHAGAIRFSLAAAATPPAEGNPSLPLSPLLACSPTPCYHRYHRHQSFSPLYRPTFLPLFLFGLSDPLSRFRLYSSSPQPARHTTLFQSLVPLFFRAVKIVCPTAFSHSSRTIERKRGRKRYFSRTARTSASAVNFGRPDRGENFAKYRGNGSRASLGSGRSDHKINRTFIGHPYQVRLDSCALDCIFHKFMSSEFSINLTLTLV